MALLIFSAVLPFSLAHAANQGGCFAQHLTDAIALNQERLPRYEALSNGESRSISKTMIRMERLTLPMAWMLDRMARPYQEQGLGVLCDEFVPMSTVAAFSAPAKPPGPKPAILRDYSGLELMGRLKRAYFDSGFSGIGAQAQIELDALSAFPGYFCMSRHFLESIRRVSREAISHEAEAQRRGLSSPTLLSKELLFLHWIAFTEVVRLDRNAAPLQERGIPIICQDVPAIQ